MVFTLNSMTGFALLFGRDAVTLLFAIVASNSSMQEDAEEFELSREIFSSSLINPLFPSMDDSVYMEEDSEMEEEEEEEEEEEGGDK